jgi:hypothetical protein
MIDSWTDVEWNQFNEWVRGMLKVGVLSVEFTKKDGTRRLMKCTLDPSILPKVELTEGTKELTITNIENVPVFDIEADGWRSFNIRSVNSVTLELV